MRRVGRCLERQRRLTHDAENQYLAAEAVDDDPVDPILGHAVTYRMAVGPHQGREVFTLQTLLARDESFDYPVSKVAGSWRGGGEGR